MISFVIKIADLLKMDSHLENGLNFKPEKKRMVIPMYQREFKWDDERILSLLTDLARNSKFLGLFILDETESKYEIVDGQQRLTTLFLSLVVLFNHYRNHDLEQNSIKRLLTPFDRILLENETIGDYLLLRDDKYELCIENDVYAQKADFHRAYQIIECFIESIQDNTGINDFKQKLLDSQVLVLLNDIHDRSHPVEQLFLDINEKSQHLQVEDIFKGHCFEKFDEEFHSDLKNNWVELKKNTTLFQQYGFKDTSEYIYTYLLETDCNSLPGNLTIAGKHYLEEKTMDETYDLIRSMIQFGEKINRFYENIRSTDYRFIDLCNNSYEYRNTEDHLSLKQMCCAVLTLPGAIYQKLPLMYFIQYLLTHEELSSEIRHSDFKRIITNLYIYTFLFVLSGEKKSKSKIDHTIRNALSSDVPIPNVVYAAKALRETYRESFCTNDSYPFDKLCFLYSVIDNYSANNNWISFVYDREKNYNLEHFIIPDNRRKIITWKSDTTMFNIPISPIVVKQFKKHLVNFLIMDEDLNEILEHYDIVYKIEKIKNWYEGRREEIPKHLRSIIDFIEGMDEYTALKMAKENNESEDIVIGKYEAFMTAYFSEEIIERNKNRIQNLFKRSFENVG